MASFVSGGGGSKYEDTIQSAVETYGIGWYSKENTIFSQIAYSERWGYGYYEFFDESPSSHPTEGVSYLIHIGENEYIAECSYNNSSGKYEITLPQNIGVITCNVEIDNCSAWDISLENPPSDDVLVSVEMQGGVNHIFQNITLLPNNWEVMSDGSYRQSTQKQSGDGSLPMFRDFCAIPLYNFTFNGNVIEGVIHKYVEQLDGEGIDVYNNGSFIIADNGTDWLFISTSQLSTNCVVSLDMRLDYYLAKNYIDGSFFKVGSIEWNSLCNVPYATTGQYGIAKLSNDIGSNSQSQAATSNAVRQVYNIANAALPKSGGTMTGTLTLSGTPTSNLHAATKKYVDDSVASIDALPSQSGNSGRYLTTNGTTASWARVKELFECTYGTTTYSEITTVINYKLPYLNRNRKCYIYSGSIGDGNYETLCFDNVSNGILSRITCSDMNVWTELTAITVVPNTRTVNSKALSSDITLTASDVGALPSTTAIPKVYYGTCSTSASTAAKSVTCSGFVLEDGATINVNFNNANSADSPTLNVNNTGAKSIKKDGTYAMPKYGWLAGQTVTFTFVGDASIGYWTVVGVNTYVTAGQKSGTTIGSYATAEGLNTTANYTYAHAEGYGTTASAQATHAEGYNTTASTNYAHAEGYGTTASGQTSHAEGYGTTASGQKSHAEGVNTEARGEASHAEGAGNLASGDFAHAEGDGTVASGDSSHAEGSSTNATEPYAHAEGVNTTAEGLAAHAEGQNTTATGDYSHAEGDSTIAETLSQHVFGEYNVADTAGSVSARGDYVEIVGNGTSDEDRSNARTLDWDGNEVLAGKLTVGSAPTNNMDVATKQYVDENGGIDPNKYYWKRRSYYYSNTQYVYMDSGNFNLAAYNGSSGTGYRCIVTYDVADDITFDASTGVVSLVNPVRITIGDAGNNDISLLTAGKYIKYVSHDGYTSNIDSAIYTYPNRIWHINSNCENSAGSSATASSRAVYRVVSSSTNRVTYFNAPSSSLVILKDETTVSSNVLNTYPQISSDFVVNPSYYPYVYKYIDSGIELCNGVAEVDEYYWKRRTYHYNAPTSPFSNIIDSSKKFCFGFKSSSDSTKYTTVEYETSDSISIDPSTGEITLDEPVANVKVGGVLEVNGETAQVTPYLRNRYFKIIGYDETTAWGTHTTYLVPRQFYNMQDYIFYCDNTLGTTTSDGYTWYYVTNTSKVTYEALNNGNYTNNLTINNDEAVVSANILNTYPNNNDFIVDSSLYPYVYKYIGCGIDLGGSWKTIAIADYTTSYAYVTGASSSGTSSKPLLSLFDYLTIDLIKKYSEFRFIIEIDKLYHTNYLGELYWGYSTLPYNKISAPEGESNASSGYIVTPGVTAYYLNGSFGVRPISQGVYDSNTGTGSSNSKTTFAFANSTYQVTLYAKGASSSSSTTRFYGRIYLQGRS